MNINVPLFLQGIVNDEACEEMTLLHLRRVMLALQEAAEDEEDEVPKEKLLLQIL